MYGLDGIQVHGEAQGDVTTATAVTLYEAGSVTARTLASTESLFITDIILSNESATTPTQVQLLAATDAGGRRAIDVILPARSSVVHRFGVPYQCPKGTTPKAMSTSGTEVSMLIQGFITSA